MIETTAICYVISVAVLLVIIFVLLHKYRKNIRLTDRLARRMKSAEDDYIKLYQQTWHYTHPDNDND